MSSSELLDQIRSGGPIPGHVAIIMDGNGRWAAERGLPRHLGHKQGMAAVREAIEGAVDAGIGNLTLFAFSTQNWERPKTEILALMGLLRIYAEKEKAELKCLGHPPTGLALWWDDTIDCAVFLNDALFEALQSAGLNDRLKASRLG